MGQSKESIPHDGHRFEYFVRKLVVSAGFVVTDPQSIRIDDAVENKAGVRKKRVTTPDFHVIDPATGKIARIEVTKGSGSTPHKQSQLSVVIAADINNYYVLTGNDIRMILEREDMRAAFCELFGWETS